MPRTGLKHERVQIFDDKSVCEEVVQLKKSSRDVMELERMRNDHNLLDFRATTSDRSELSG